MSVAFQIVGPPLRPRPAQPIVGVDPLTRLVEARARADAAIETIDAALAARTVCACVLCGVGLAYPAVTCSRCTRTERRAAPPPDERPRGPVEYSGARGRILEIR